MATGFEFFERDLRLATIGLEPDQIDRALAAFAKQELQRVISSGQAPALYERFVNGVPGAAEESVRAPGPIVYDFVNWSIVITEALAELKKRAPVKSGRYAAGFVVLVAGRPVAEYTTIPATAEVIIINTRPYTRKIESGANGDAGKRHVEKTKNSLAARARWKGVFDFDMRFVLVAAGVHPDVPYILKGGAPLTRAAQSNRSSAFRSGREFLSRRKDRQPGQPITYPALIINPD